jgi:hypothetical protein
MFLGYVNGRGYARILEACKITWSWGHHTTVTPRGVLSSLSFFFFDQKSFSPIFNPFFYGLCGESVTTLMMELGFSIQTCTKYRLSNILDPKCLTDIRYTHIVI